MDTFGYCLPSCFLHPCDFRDRPALQKVRDKAPPLRYCQPSGLQQTRCCVPCDAALLCADEPVTQLNVAGRDKSCREVEILLYTAAVMLAVIGVVHPLQLVGYCLDLGEVLLGVLRVRREIILHGDALYRSVCKAVHDRFAVSACVRLVPVQPA